MTTISNSSLQELESHSQEQYNLTVEKTNRAEYLHASSAVQQPKLIVRRKRLSLITNA